MTMRQRIVNSDLLARLLPSQEPQKYEFFLFYLKEGISTPEADLFPICQVTITIVEPFEQPETDEPLMMWKLADSLTPFATQLLVQALAKATVQFNKDKENGQVDAD